MLLRDQRLNEPVRRHFGLRCDPFARDLESQDDVFRCPDMRYITEAMWDTARHGGFMAVVGASGSGKTTLLNDLCERIATDGEPVTLVRPDVTGMGRNDREGRVLRVADIQEAILADLCPDEPLRRSPEARARQLKRALIAAKQNNRRVCVAFDEAHRMPTDTLRHLKRLREIFDGHTRLVSIILLGHLDLGIRLSSKTPEVEEVTRRCMVCTLAPLDDQLVAYLRHKLIPAGRALEDIITPDGIDALRERLGIAPLDAKVMGNAQASRAYPLGTANLMAAAMILAAASGAPKVAGAIIRMVGA